MEITEAQRDVEAVPAHYAKRHNARAGQVRDEGRSDGELEQDFRSDLADVFAQVLLIPKRFELDRPIASKWLVWKSEIENASQ